MKILIASDFFAEFELIECNNQVNAIDYVKSQGTKNDGIKILANHDSATEEHARSMADAVLFTSDILDD